MRGGRSRLVNRRRAMPSRMITIFRDASAFGSAFAPPSLPRHAFYSPATRAVAPDDADCSAFALVRPNRSPYWRSALTLRRDAEGRWGSRGADAARRASESQHTAESGAQQLQTRLSSLVLTLISIRGTRRTLVLYSYVSTPHKISYRTYTVLCNFTVIQSNPADMCD